MGCKDQEIKDFDQEWGIVNEDGHHQLLLV
jgi:hypothetical protein